MMDSQEGKEEQGPRQRTLTEKGQQLFEEKVDSLVKKYDRLKKEIYNVQKSFDSEPHLRDSERIQKLERHVSDLQERLMSVSNDIIIFLSTLCKSATASNLWLLIDL